MIRLKKRVYAGGIDHPPIGEKVLIMSCVFDGDTVNPHCIGTAIELGKFDGRCYRIKDFPVACFAWSTYTLKDRLCRLIGRSPEGVRLWEHTET